MAHKPSEDATVVDGLPGEGVATPRYQQVAEDLMTRIRRQEYPVGSMLPTEVKLGESYGVSRHTIREALRTLEELGLVQRQQGSGTSVLGAEPSDRFVQEISDLDQLLQYPVDTKLFVLRASHIEIDQALSKRLNVPVGSRWLKVEGIRRVKVTASPICMTTVYVPSDYSDVVEDIGVVSDPVYTLIAKRYGLRVTEVEVEFVATNVPEAKSEILEVATGQPALTIIRRYRDQFNKLFELSESIHPAAAFSYRLRWKRANPAG